MKPTRESKLPSGPALGRFLVKQLRAARRAWIEAPGRREAVHAVRKKLKSVRALLRLLRPMIGKRHWRKIDHALCKIARSLSPLREAQVDERTCRALALPKSAGATQLRHLLRARLDEVRRNLPGKHTLSKALRDAREQLKELSLDAVTDRGLRVGLTRMHKTAERAAHRARTSPSVEATHDWRKAVKNLGYVLPVLLGDSAARESLRALEKLGDVLGDEHDLALFEVLVADQLAGAGHDRLLARLVKRRAALRAEAIALAQNWK